MKLLNFLYQVKSEQVPRHLYIKSSTNNLYLGNNGKMEDKKVVFEVQKETKNGLVSQTLYNIENKNPLKFEYMKSANDKNHEYVPEDKNNVTFNYVDISGEKAKIMIGEGNCLIRKKDNSVFAHKCSHYPNNKDEIFVIKNEKPKEKKADKRSYHQSSDEYSEVSEKKPKKKKVIPHNTDNDLEYSDSFSTETSFDTPEEYTKTSESTIEEKPIKQTKIKKHEKIPVKKKTQSNNLLENPPPINQEITTSQAYSTDNTSSEFPKVIKKLQETVNDLIEKLNKQNSGREEKNLINEDNLQKNVYRDNTPSAPGFDSSLNDIYESIHEINSKNDYSKNNRDPGNYHISSDETKSLPNTHNYSLNSNSFDIKDHVHHFSEHLEDVYNTKLDKMKAKENKILNLIRNIDSGNIEKISLELKNLLEHITNIRLEYIQNAQNKANEYLMSLSNLTTKILNLQKYLANFRANSNNFSSTARPQNFPPGDSFVI